MTTSDYNTPQSKKRSLPQSTESSKKQKTQLTFPEFKIEIPALYNPFINIPDGSKCIIFQSIREYGSFWGSPDTDFVERLYRELELEQEQREIAAAQIQINEKQAQFFRENRYFEEHRILTEKNDKLNLNLIKLDLCSQNLAKSILNTNFYKETCSNLLFETFQQKLPFETIDLILDFVHERVEPATFHWNSEGTLLIKKGDLLYNGNDLSNAVSTSPTSRIQPQAQSQYSDLPFAVTDDEDEVCECMCTVYYQNPFCNCDCHQ